MHAIFSFTSAYPKLGHLSKQNIVSLYQCAQLSQLMWNPLCSNPCWVIIACMQWHGLSMCILRSLWPQRRHQMNITFVTWDVCWDRNEVRIELFLTRQSLKKPAADKSICFVFVSVGFKNFQPTFSSRTALKKIVFVCCKNVESCCDSSNFWADRLWNFF